MDYTSNYQLKKPAAADQYNIEDFNENADTIDEKLQVGQQALTLANQLLTRVAKLETQATTLNARTQVFLTMYGLPGTNITLSCPTSATTVYNIGASGKATATLNNTGEYTIEYKYNGKTYTRMVTIDYIGETVVALAPELELCGWDFIDLVSGLGLADTCWSVGDTKEITVSGESMIVRILDFNHDTLYSQDTGCGRKASITFGLTEPLPDQMPMHSNSDEKIPWSQREMHTIYLEMFKEELEYDLQACIKTVAKTTMLPWNANLGNYGNYSNEGAEETAEDLFLFSEAEIFGDSRLSNPYYQYERPYEYFRRGNPFICSGDYWLRDVPSAQNDPYTYSIYVATNGRVYCDSVTDIHGLLFGFCV